MTESFIEERLKICNTCPYNIENMCVICGCDISHKVKDKEESCPKTPKSWSAVIEPKVYKQPPQIKIAGQEQMSAPQQNKPNECIPCNKHRH